MWPKEQSLLLPLQQLLLLSLLAVLEQQPHQPADIILHKPPEGLTGVLPERDDQLTFPQLSPRPLGSRLCCLEIQPFRVNNSAAAGLCHRPCCLCTVQPGLSLPVQNDVGVLV